MKQMRYESGTLSPEIDENLSSDEADEAEQRLQDKDPNFKA